MSSYRPVSAAEFNITEELFLLYSTSAKEAFWEWPPLAKKTMGFLVVTLTSAEVIRHFL